jgi:GNAT superfamily N-acetyltransferase
MPQWEIARLAKWHDRVAFDCGNAALNDWLKLRAGQFERRDLARTYVAVRPGQPVVLAYYALSTHRVSFDALPADQAKNLPRTDVPVVLLGCLAVDRSEQGKGLGEHLLIDALRRAELTSGQVGVRAVEVDAVNDAARRFYLRYGFIPLRDNPNHLFLPMSVVRRLALPP